MTENGDIWNTGETRLMVCDKIFLMSKWAFGEISEGEWDEFVKSQPGNNFYQSTMRIRKREAIGYKSYIVGVRNRNKILGGGVLVGQKGEYWMPYGPLLDFNNLKLLKMFLSEIVQFAKERKMIKIEIFPRVVRRVRSVRLELLEENDLTEVIKVFKDIGFLYVDNRVTYEPKAAQRVFIRSLVGVKSANELFNSYRKTLRARFRKTAGLVKVEELTREQLPELARLLDQSDEHNGVNGRSLDYFQKIFDAAGDSVRFVVARKTDTGEAIAATMFTVYGGEVMSWLSGMDRRYKELIGRAYIQDYMMKWALEHKIYRINLMGIDGKKADGLGLLEHMVEFKSGFGGGVVEEYLGRFYLVLRPVRWFFIRVKRKIGRFL
jgi:lipid II:glycine glycyltransferase (peptidoglycan interpeptide bridge formation enzyme)